MSTSGTEGDLRGLEPHPEGAYRVPAGEGEGEIREKGSRFLAFVLPVSGEEGAREALEGLARRFSDASHHCWAWRLGPGGRERASDAGEPAGTAGVPILQVLRGAELTDVLAVVVRWFGGTKLGKGGLARAYSAAAREALRDLPTDLRVPTEVLTLELAYPQIGAVKRLVHPPEVVLVREEYGAAVHLELAVWRSRREALEAALADLGVAVPRSSTAAHGRPP